MRYLVVVILTVLVISCDKENVAGQNPAGSDESPTYSMMRGDFDVVCSGYFDLTGSAHVADGPLRYIVKVYLFDRNVMNIDTYWEEPGNLTYGTGPSGKGDFVFSLKDGFVNADFTEATLTMETYNRSTLPATYVGITVLTMTRRTYCDHGF